MADCQQCHKSQSLLRFDPMGIECVDCHINNFNSTTNPNHAAAGISTDCKLCHSINNWTSATYDHSAFPLTGGHNIACALCHINNNYNLSSTNCYDCHQATYVATTNPNHIGAGFPTDCKLCHSINNWTPATFNHTWFPIYSGKHKQGVWNTCADCHINASNYAVFSCTGCHNKTQTDNDHDGVSNYQYNSNACYSCHPNGNSK